MLKDISVRNTPKEKSSRRFTVQRIVICIIPGVLMLLILIKMVLWMSWQPYIYFGPDYTNTKKLFRLLPLDIKEFTRTNVQFTFDFNGDGWTDVLTSPPELRCILIRKGNPGAEKL
jgi:hypothetical protein